MVIVTLRAAPELGGAETVIVVVPAPETGLNESHEGTPETDHEQSGLLAPTDIPPLPPPVPNDKVGDTAKPHAGGTTTVL